LATYDIDHIWDYLGDCGEPLFLIEMTGLHSRADISRHCHFTLNPSHLFSAVRKLFAAPRPACNCR
jgi:hypothetical protein